MYRKALLCLITIVVSSVSFAATRVAVMDLHAKAGVSKDLASLLSDTLRAAAFNERVFDLMNREDMADILREVKFQQSGACESTSCVVSMGNALGVEKIITGSIGKLDDRYVLTVKLVDIAKSKNDIFRGV